MGSGDPTGFSARELISGVADELRASFGLPAGIAIVLGVALGFGLPELDELLDARLPAFSFDAQDSAAGLLETVATVTVSLAGLAFSITVVAFTLTSSQLSPRLLRSFRSDRLSQAALALLLGTAVYCLVLLVRLGTRSEGVPDISVTAALALALASFLLFAVFIAHIARMLQPSTVIAGLLDEAKAELDHRFPGGIGSPPDDPDRARERARRATEAATDLPVEADDDGYLTLIQGERLIALASKADALVVQGRRVGEYVTPGEELARIYVSGVEGDERDSLIKGVRGCFALARQRSLVQDVTFAVRQLADIALKGLSPGINDPTTAKNAMDAAATVIIRFARAERESEIRMDEEDAPRFVAAAPTLGDLVQLAFEQPGAFASPDPSVAPHLLDLLDRIGTVAGAAGLDLTEVERQARRLRSAEAGD